MSGVVVPREVFRPVDSRSGQLVAFGIGHDGATYVACALNAEDSRIERPGGATFFKTQPDAPQSYRLRSWRDGKPDLDVTVEQEAFNVTEIQPLGDDILLVCPRCHRNDGATPERNARVYQRSGTLKREFTVGDGIQNVQCTARREIWVGYFDEGVFGNYGWREPLGAAGFVAWSETGSKLYEYEASAPHGSIADCYAMNVMLNGDVWCYYYTDFPLVQIRELAVKCAWEVPVKGAHAVAIDGDLALFCGSYETADQFLLIQLQSQSQGQTRVVGRCMPADRSGERLTIGRAYARDSRILFSSGDGLFETSVEECRLELDRSS